MIEVTWKGTTGRAYVTQLSELWPYIPYKSGSLHLLKAGLPTNGRQFTVGETDNFDDQLNVSMGTIISGTPSSGNARLACAVCMSMVTIAMRLAI